MNERAIVTPPAGRTRRLSRIELRGRTSPELLTLALVNGVAVWQWETIARGRLAIAGWETPFECVVVDGMPQINAATREPLVYALARVDLPTILATMTRNDGKRLPRL